MLDASGDFILGPVVKQKERNIAKQTVALLKWLGIFTVSLVVWALIMVGISSPVYYFFTDKIGLVQLSQTSNYLHEQTGVRQGSNLSAKQLAELYPEAGIYTWIGSLTETWNVLDSLPQCVLDTWHSSVFASPEIVYVSEIKVRERRPSGVFKHRTNQILIKALNVNDVESVQFRGTLYHEIGHAYFFNSALRVPRIFKFWAVPHQYIISRLFLEHRFRSAVEGENPPTKYATKNSGEDMAESFELFFTKPEFLKSIAPKRYGYIEEAVSC